MTHRILFVADGGPQVGGGHVMRCLTLVEAVAARGASAEFVVPDGAAAMVAGASRDLAVHVAGPGRDFLDLAAERVQAGGVSAVVVDGYRIAAEAEARLAQGRPLLALDDLADRPHACAALVDSGLGRTAADYAGLVPAGASVLTGPDYAPIRAAFAEARPQALPRRGQASKVDRVLVSLGLTDVGGISERVVRVLLPLLGEARMAVALGAGAPSLPGLRALAAGDARLSLHVDAWDMARLCAEADIAVGAGGGSAWERAVVGLPSLTLALADNQRRGVERMAAAGGVLGVSAVSADFEDALAQGFRDLTGEAGLRRSLAERSAALCDGQGARRAAEALLGLL